MTNTRNDKSNSTGLSTPQWIVAGLITLGFAMLVMFTLRRLGIADTQWTRLTYVYGSIQTLATTAVGAMLGIAVTKTTAAAESKRADRAESAAAANAQLAKVGEVAKASLLVAARGDDGDPGRFAVAVGPGNPPRTAPIPSDRSTYAAELLQILVALEQGSAE